MNSPLTRLLLLFVVAIGGSWLAISTRAAQPEDPPRPHTAASPHVLFLPMAAGAMASVSLTSTTAAIATTLPSSTPRPSHAPTQSTTSSPTRATTTESPSSTASATPWPSGTPTPSQTPSQTTTNTASATAIPTHTPTATNTATVTASPAYTRTPTDTSTPTTTNTATVTASPTNTSTPSVTPVRVQAHKWAATTQQNASFGFYVTYALPQRVEYFEDVRIQAGSCEVISYAWQNIDRKAEISNDQFVISLSRLVVRGAFTSSTSAAGTIEFSDPGGSCGGPVSIPWIARWSANVTPTFEGT